MIIDDYACPASSAMAKLFTESISFTDYIIMSLLIIPLINEVKHVRFNKMGKDAGNTIVLEW